MIPVLLALLLASCSSLAAGTRTADCTAATETSSSEAMGPGTMAGKTGAMSAAQAAELAVFNAPGLKAERESLELRHGAWKLGLRSFLPSLELSAGTDERLSIFGPDSFTKTLSLSIGQPVWDGGRLHAARTLEASELALARTELERAVRDTAEAAITSYRSVVAARLRLGIERSSLDAAIAERDILAAEIDLGLAKPSGLLEADLRLMDQKLKIAESELDVSIACSELAEALGVGPLPELSEIPGHDRAIIALAESSLIAAAVDRSPELDVARQVLSRKRAEAKAATYAWLPTIGIKASGQLGGTRLPLTRASWAVGLTIDFSGPYLSGTIGGTRGGEFPSDSNAGTSLRLQALPDPAGALRIKSAVLTARLEEEKYSSAVAAVERSAKASVNVYLNSLQKRQICADGYSLAEEKVQLVNLQISLGQAVRSDAVEAELARAGKEAELIDAVMAIVAAERGLERLLDLPPGCLQEFVERYGAPVRADLDPGMGQ